jgi:ankyrin repeat protein
MSTKEIEEFKKLMYEKGLDYRNPETNDTLLHLAARIGDPALFKFVLYDSKFKCAQTMFGYTPLHILALKGDVELGKMLLTSMENEERKRLLSLGDCKNDTVLHFAVNARKKQFIRLLFEYGVNVSIQNTKGYNALHAGVENTGNASIIELFREVYPNSLELTTQEGNTLIHVAVLFEQAHILSYLVKTAKLNVEAKNNIGESAMHLAAKKDNIEAMMELHALGSALHLRDNHNRTPLHVACKAGAEKCVQWLLPRISSIEIVDGFNKTPLKYAAGCGNVNVITMLLDYEKKNIKVK